MKHIGVCPASCGELIQGKDERGEFLTSYCVPLYSEAVLCRAEKQVRSKFYEKAYKALERLFRMFGEEKELQKIGWRISSNIPRGKGMSSSTADIGAILGAGVSYLGVSIDADQATKIAAAVEPTDSIFYKSLTLIDPLSGERLRILGEMPRMKVLILEPSVRVETESMRKNPNYEKYKNEKIKSYKKMLESLEQGIKEKAPETVGKIAMKSALLNQQLLQKAELEKIIETADVLGAYGVNIAHSGSIVGILMDVRDEERRYTQRLIEQKIAAIYGRMYCLPIIGGGIKKGKEQRNGVREESISD